VKPGTDPRNVIEAVAEAQQEQFGEMEQQGDFDTQQIGNVTATRAFYTASFDTVDPETVFWILGFVRGQQAVAITAFVSAVDYKQAEASIKNFMSNIRISSGG
jgi:hypothetical protein